MFQNKELVDNAPFKTQSMTYTLQPIRINDESSTSFSFSQRTLSLHCLLLKIFGKNGEWCNSGIETFE